ncbi:hypothetical protein [uncultured Alistipes sp.]|jgi:hypothetical protein|nr:hypothetical protein [uncultured Alistipes sp.]
MDRKNQLIYLAPAIELMEIEHENGFAASSGVFEPGGDPFGDSAE